MKRLAIALTLAATCLGASTTTPRPALAAPAATDAPKGLGLAIQKAKLDNGLRVVMNVDRSAPTVAVAVTYDVGARNEQVGRSGFAHLFEHMMFQGSANAPKGTHFKLIQARGGTMNGTTSSERTNYYEMLPSNELALGLWLEADRMKTLAVTQENFENQRKVVQEEYRLRISNAAYGPARLRLNELIYKGYWPYEHSVIGKMADLDNADFEWVLAFHKSYYAPNNAVLTISGDFETDEAMRLVREYFGDAKPQPSVPVYEAPPTPEQKEERVATIEDKNAKTAGLYYGWMIPETRTPEHYALEMATMVLTSGEASRLHQKMVRDQSIAQRVSAWTYDYRAPDALVMFVQLSEKATIKRVEKVLDDEVASLAKKGPTARELERAKRRLRSSFVFGLESALRRAVVLGEFEVIWGDARLLNRELLHYEKVTKEQIRDAVKKHLTRARRNVVQALPVKEGSK